MSPIAKLLQIKPAKEIQRQSFLGSVWSNFLGILRTTKFQRREKRLEVVERITLSNKQSVVLMRLDEREFMVGCCGDAVVLLAPPQTPVMPAEVMERFKAGALALTSGCAGWDDRSDGRPSGMRTTSVRAFAGLAASRHPHRETPSTVM